MGSFHLRLGATRAESYDEEAISAFPAGLPTTAMRVIERGGDFFYGGEVEVFVWNLPRAIGKHSFVRLEVKCEARASSPIKNGHHAVLSTHPYSLGWCHVEPFKPSRFEGRYNFDTTRAEESDLAGALAYLAQLECDFWETGHFRTAGFSSIGQRQSWSGQRDNRIDLLHVLGVCEDANAYQRQLMEHPRVQKLLAETEKKTIRIGRPGVHIADEVVEERFVLMTLAVRQALAGPHKDGVRWVTDGRPVHDKVDRIYRDLLNARNRSVVKRLQRE